MVAYLLNGVVGLPTSINILTILDILDPRLTRRSPAQWPPSKESEVAVCHVLVLGAKQKPRHHREPGVTVDDHCAQHRHTQFYVLSINLSSLQHPLLSHFSLHAQNSNKPDSF